MRVPMSLSRFFRALSSFVALLFFAVLIAPSLCHAEGPGWPRTIVKPGGKLVLYQPQVDDWKSFQVVDARMAFTVTPTGGKQRPGVVTVQLQSTVNMDAHTVFLNDPKVTNVYFPGADQPTTAQLDQLVRTFLNPSASMTISLDQLVASVKKTQPASVAAVKNDPPTIFISFKPAILLMVNGAPVLAAIADSNLQYVVNANWPLFQDKSNKTYYLFDSKGWLTASSLEANWSPIAKLPRDMSKVPSNSNFTDLRPFIPPAAGSTATYPAVYYSATPAEIVVFTGQPQWAPIPNTQLVYATNTGSNVFKYNPTGALYYLTSGRWFTSTGAIGPWKYATDSLPPDFAQIPVSSPAGRVLASVPGTPEAEDAVLLAQIPTTVVVSPTEAAKEVKVSYVGEPQFVPIAGTSLYYATNTQNRVIQAGPQYYLCYQGVWFVSASANGPWQTAQTVPSVIYTIPPTSPVYNVTYVTQAPTSNGDIQASYTAGYMGVFIAGATIGAICAEGTGYYYPPYVGFYGAYPAYYPYAATYGYHYAYNPYTGAYGAGGAAYGPYGSAHWGAAYNPTTGTYARGATASTAYGSRTVAQAYNPYTGAYGATRQGSNAYGSWGQSVYSKNGNTAYTQHATNAYGSVGTVQTSQGGRGAATSTAYGNTAAGKTSNGDMYAGHDGNAYKNTGSGWQKYDNGSWNTVDKSTAQASAQQKTQSYDQAHPSGSSSYSDLNQEAQNRARGAQQSQNFSQYQHSGGWGSSSHSGGGWGGGGDRWGGGGFDRGGGGFRR